MYSTNRDCSFLFFVEEAATGNAEIPSKGERSQREQTSSAIVSRRAEQATGCESGW